MLFRGRPVSYMWQQVVSKRCTTEANDVSEQQGVRLTYWYETRVGDPECARHKCVHIYLLIIWLMKQT